MLSLVASIKFLVITDLIVGCHVEWYISKVPTLTFSIYWVLMFMCTVLLGVYLLKVHLVQNIIVCVIGTLIINGSCAIVCSSFKTYTF